MRTPLRLGLFSDIKPVLDAALVASGGTFQCASHGAAVHWRQRAYRFRKLYAEQNLKEESKYDRLTLPKIPSDSSIVVIEVRQPAGSFTPNQSAPILDDNNLDPDLLSAAIDFAKKLEI